MMNQDGLIDVPILDQVPAMLLQRRALRKRRRTCQSRAGDNDIFDVPLVTSASELKSAPIKRRRKITSQIGTGDLFDVPLATTTSELDNLFDIPLTNASSELDNFFHEPFGRGACGIVCSTANSETNEMVTMKNIADAVDYPSASNELGNLFDVPLASASSEIVPLLMNSEKNYLDNLYDVPLTNGSSELDFLCDTPAEVYATCILNPSAQQEHADTIMEGGTANIRRKRENVQGCGELESLTRTSREPVVESESLEHYKTKCFELSVELEKKKAECTKLQGKLLAEVEETRKTASVAEDATEYWKKIALRMENENSTMRCVISNLESLLLMNGKESSVLRCLELHNSEKIVSEALGLQNEVTQSGEKHNTSKLNAETSSGGRKDCHVFELRTEENVLLVHGIGIGINKHHESESEFPNYSAVNISSGSLHLPNGGENVEEGKKGWDCSEERPFQDHLEMIEKPLVNLVSDDDSVEILGESEDSDSSTDSKGSLGDLMDMLAMKYRNRNKDKEIKWKFEADMLSSLEEDPGLCLKAVCALYRQQISEDEISDKGWFHYSDVLRCTALAKYLTDDDCKGDLKKSFKELEVFNSKAVDDCKRLARKYSTQLFSIYQNGKDPFFLPATTASHGDQTAK